MAFEGKNVLFAMFPMVFILSDKQRLRRAIEDSGALRAYSMPKMTKLMKILPSKIARGSFSGERVFKINLANGEEYISLAPFIHLLGSDKTPLDRHQPPAETEIDGYVVARPIKKEGSYHIVEVPDGELVMVPSQSLGVYPRESSEHVPV